MRVLITGGGGFLAGHLLAELQAIAGIETRSLMRAECDLARDRVPLMSVLRAFQPDRVVHLAGRINGSGSELIRDQPTRDERTSSKPYDRWGRVSELF